MKPRHCRVFRNSDFRSAAATASVASAGGAHARTCSRLDRTPVIRLYVGRTKIRLPMSVPAHVLLRHVLRICKSRISSFPNEAAGVRSASATKAAVKKEKKR
eukprot:6212588-Pleurochrysis_carterae.AAC.5